MTYHAKYNYQTPPRIVALFRAPDGDAGAAEFYDQRAHEWVFSGVAVTAIGWDMDVVEVSEDVANAVLERWQRTS